MNTTFRATFAKKYMATVALACGIVVSVTPAVAGITRNLPSVAKRACTAATDSEWLIQISQIGFQDAANKVLREVKGAESVVQVERYGDVYYVTVSTSRGYQTHCVRATNGKYLGSC